MEAISIKATVRSVLKERDASTSEATQREGRQGEGEHTKLVRGQGFEVWVLYRLTFPDEVGVKLPAQNSGSNPGQYTRAFKKYRFLDPLPETNKIGPGYNLETGILKKVLG